MSDIERAKAKAIEARDRYLSGLITFKQAKEEMREYIDLFNRKSIEIAQKYNQKPKKLSVGDFLRNKYY